MEQSEADSQSSNKEHSELEKYKKNLHSNNIYYIIIKHNFFYKFYIGNITIICCYRFGSCV